MPDDQNSVDEASPRRRSTDNTSRSAASPNADARGQGGKRRRTRIVDIASEAGVSVSTVNRVLSRSNNVRSSTVQRVLRVAVDMGYSLDSAQCAAAQTKPMRLLFLLPAGNNRFIDMLGDYIAIVERTFAPFSIKCQLRFHTALDAADLAAKLLKYGQRADGVAFIALEHELVREAVDRLVELGRHVVTLVSDLSNSRRIAYVGVDNYAAGRTAGYLVGRLLCERSGKIVVIAGSRSYLGHQQREEGFRAVVRETFPHIEILGVGEAQEDPMMTYKLTRKMLGRHADLVGIYNIGGGPDGVARAIKEAQMERKVLFVGHEVTSETRSYLVDGTLDAVINQSAQTEILNAIRVFTNLRDARMPKTGLEEVRIGIFVRENLP